jgi:hypothetical protein
MRALDVPEILIGAGLLALVAWGIYNWMHRAQIPR